MAIYDKHTWTSGELITPDKLNHIENQLEQVTSGATVISEEYSAAKTYHKNDYCLYNGELWRCKNTSTGNTPVNGAYWENTSLLDELSNIQNALEMILSNNE